MSLERDLWIDGRLFSVPHEVWAHVQFILAANKALERSLATTLAPTPAEGSPGASLGRRWTVKRKTAVLMLIEAELLTEDGAMAQFEISSEELNEWRARVARLGAPGLSVAAIQGLRDAGEDHATRND